MRLGDISLMPKVLHTDIHRTLLVSLKCCGRYWTVRKGTIQAANYIPAQQYLCLLYFRIAGNSEKSIKVLASLQDGTMFFNPARFNQKNGQFANGHRFDYWRRPEFVIK